MSSFDTAVLRLEFLLDHLRPTVRDYIAERYRIELHVIARDMRLTDLPPWQYLDPSELTANPNDGERTWGAVRGVGPPPTPEGPLLVAAGEETFVPDRSAALPAGHVLFHELGHMVHVALPPQLQQQVEEHFLERLRALGEDRSQWLPPVAYTKTNSGPLVGDEYFANAVAAYFEYPLKDVSFFPTPEAPSELRYNRAWLRENDPGMYDILTEVFEPLPPSVYCRGEHATHRPEPANETVDGTRSIDVFVGGETDDSFEGGRGHDMACGGGGNDRLSGGHGNDVLDGGAGADTLAGDGGRDTLRGRTGGDRLRGGMGADLLKGGAGADHLDGGRGPDFLQAGKGSDDDDLSGGGGDDVLVAFDGGGSDRLAGGDGDDELRGSNGDDHLVGGDGADTLDGSLGDDVLDGASESRADWLRLTDRLDGSVGDDRCLVSPDDATTNCENVRQTGP